MKIKKIVSSATLAAGCWLLAAVPALAQVEHIVIDEPKEGIKDFGDLLSAGIQLALIIAAILTFAFLIWGGIEWIASGGNKEKYEAARGRITAALVGLAIVAAAWALMKLIEHFFGVSVFDFRVPSAAPNR